MSKQLKQMESLGPGYRTSEGIYPIILAILVTGLALAAAIQENDVFLIFTLLAGVPSIAGTVVAYINGRTRLKELLLQVLPDEE